MKIRGVGPVTATAVIASAVDGKVFRNGRRFAARLGLTPRQHSTGGRQRLRVTSKHGNVYLRTWLIHGARAMLRVTPDRGDAKSRWAEGLRRRRPYSVVRAHLRRPEFIELRDWHGPTVTAGLRCHMLAPFSH